MSQITDTFEKLSELPFINVTDQKEVRILVKKDANFKPKAYTIESFQAPYESNVYEVTVNQVIDQIKSNASIITGLNTNSNAEAILSNVETAAKVCAESGSFGAVPVAIMSVDTYEILRSDLVSKSNNRIYSGGIFTNLPFYPIVDRKVTEDITVFLSPVKGKSNTVVMPMPVVQYTEIGVDDNIIIQSGVLIPQEFKAVTITK